MKISAIQNHQTCRINTKPNNIRKFDTTTPNDVVNFQGRTTKGIGIGALVGLGAMAIISGGAAAPVAYAAYAVIMGTAGGMMGHAIDKTDKENKKDNK